MIPRILWIGESAVLNTGYAVYAREVLKRLYAMGKYDIAELACYVDPTDRRLDKIPWKVYPVLPHPNDPNKNRYNHNSQDQFGAGEFERVCLDFKPHVVVTYRDYWMDSFVDVSPFRKCFNLLSMPTCDATPQNKQWLSLYSNANGIFTYQDWSKEILEKESGGKIKVICSAPPCADIQFNPISANEKAFIKKQLGLYDFRIIGTVMRNQRRKLFPDLFEAFRKFIDNTQYNDVVLYCHTSYPDMGWDLPKYIEEYGLSSKVFFTYVCRNCRSVAAKNFSDAITPCNDCGGNMTICNVQVGLSNEVLSKIYNCFDLYVQYSNSEGMGMPQVEAAACGVPIMSVDYSAMSDVVRKLKGIPLKVLKLDNEIETGCKRAIPDNDYAADRFKDFFSLDPNQVQRMRIDTRFAYEEHYNWDTTTGKWANYIDNLHIQQYEDRWVKPINIHSPIRFEDIPTDLSNSDFAKFILIHVLGEPERVNSYMEARLIKDLNYEISTGGMHGLYYNEMGAAFEKPNYSPFNKRIAYDEMLNLCNRRNGWEKIREKVING